MRSVPVLWLAMACVPPDEQEAVEVDGVPFLTLGESLEGAFDDRALLITTPFARLTPDGPELSAPIPQTPRPFVVVDPGAWPRIGLDVGGVRVLVYVDRGSLQRRIVASAPGPVELPIGQPVEVIDEWGDELQAVAALKRSAVAEAVALLTAGTHPTRSTTGT